MAQRFCLCDVIGNGTEANPYRPVIANHNVSWVCILASSAINGSPLKTWSLVLVDTTDFTAIAADNKIDLLPAYTLDKTTASLTTQEKNAIRNFLTKRGLDPNFVTTAVTLRDLIQLVGAAQDPAFNMDDFRIG